MEPQCWLQHSLIQGLARNLGQFCSSFCLWERGISEDRHRRPDTERLEFRIRFFALVGLHFLWILPFPPSGLVFLGGQIRIVRNRFHGIEPIE